jgi:predicted nuclease of predicted toxin-antitoxin system
MPCRIKVDEDLPRDVADLLRSKGHDALTVVEEHLGGFADEKLWPIVQAEQRLLFTADRGFGDARLFPPGSHCGVVLFRLPRESRKGYVLLVELLLQTVSLDQLAGALVLVSPDALRISQPP